MSCTSAPCTTRPYLVPAEQPAVEPVTLRPATPDDAATLALVGAATFLEAYTWMLPGEDIVNFCARHHTTEAYAKYLALPGTRITLAVTESGAPIGYAMLCEPELPNFDVLPTDTELKRIYVFTRFRSSSTPVTNPPAGCEPTVRVAQALLAAAMDDARAMGAKRMLLGTNEGNQRAIAFYRRNGFSEAGRRTFVVGACECCDLLLSRDI